MQLYNDAQGQKINVQTIMPHILPPPLFSPFVYNPCSDSKVFYKTRSYTEQEDIIAAHMVAETVLLSATLMNTLYIVERFSLNIKWCREIKVTVHEARNMQKNLTGALRDVRCKVTVNGNIGRTRIIPSGLFIWDEQFSFNVHEPCDIRLLAYSYNKFLPNDKIGRIKIEPQQMVERQKICEWFSLDTKGEIKLTPFKFFVNHNLLNFGNFHISDAFGIEAFRVQGRWPSDIFFLDKNNIGVLIRKNFGFMEQNSYSVLNLPGVCGVEAFGYHSFKFFGVKNQCVASVLPSSSGFQVEINPDQDIILILASVIVIAKTMAHQKCGGGGL